MNKGLLTWMFGIIVLLISVISASATVPSGGVAYYKGDVNFFDEWNGYNGTNRNVINSTNYPTFNIARSGSPKSGDYNTNKYCALPDLSGSFGVAYYNFSVSLWLKINDSDWKMAIGTNNTAGDSDNTYWFFGYTSDAGGFYTALKSDIAGSNTGVAYIFGSNRTLEDNTWHHLAITVANDTDNDGNIEAADVKIYLDGDDISNEATNITSDDSGSLITQNPFEEGVMIGAFYGAGGEWTGLIDEVKIFNKTLNSIEISNMYNYGNIEEGEIVITLNAPTNADYNDSLSIGFVYTPVSTTGTLTNCSLWTNETGSFILEETNSSIIVNNSLNTITHTLPSDGDFLWNVECHIATNSSFASSNFTLTIDTTPPIIKADNIKYNQTFVYKLNLTAQINASDANLYSFNISSNRSGLIFNTTSISNTLYQYNLSYNVSAYPIGKYKLDVWACDGHTDKIIPDYNYTIKVDNSLQYLFNKDYININPGNADWFDSFTTRKKIDRYSFEYKKSLMGKLFTSTHTYSFTVESSQPIDIIKNSEYPGHMVIYGLHKWIDFNVINVPEAKVTLKRINTNKVDVIITNVPNKITTLIFESVGELNCEHKVYEWWKLNITTEDKTGVIEKETFNLNLTISFDEFKNEGNSISTNAILIYNNTAHTPTKTNTSTYDKYSVSFAAPEYNVSMNTSIIYNWTYNVTGTYINITNNITTSTTQTIHRMFLNNCSNLSTYALNFTIRDETTEDLVGNVTVVIGFDIWYDNSSFTRHFNYDRAKTPSTFSVCIAPYWVNYTSDYDITLTKTGYNDRGYSYDNVTLSNTTVLTTLYMLNLGNATLITINVLDEYEDGLQGRVVEAYLYNLDSDDYTLITSETTDSNGVCKMYLDARLSKSYRFLVKYEDVIVYTHPTMKLFETEYIFTIGAAIVSDVGFEMGKVITSITYNRTTFEVLYTYNDPEDMINSTRMTVYYKNLSNAIYASTVTPASTGTINYTITPESGNTTGWHSIKAEGLFISDGAWHTLQIYIVDIKAGWDIFDTDALWIGAIFIGTLIFVGLTIGIEAALTANILGLIVFSILGLFQISMTAVIALGIVAIIIMVKSKRSGL